MSINQIKAIAKATANKLSNNEDLKVLKQSRLDVCKSCPLFKKQPGRSFCNSSLSIHRITGEVLPVNHSKYNTKEYQKGCGCTLESPTLPEKTTVIGFNNTCPARKWDLVESELFMGDIKFPKEFRKAPTQYITKNSVSVTVRKFLPKSLLSIGFIYNNDTYVQTVGDIVISVDTTLSNTEIFVEEALIAEGNFSLVEIQNIVNQIKENIKDNQITDKSK